MTFLWTQRWKFKVLSVPVDARRRLNVYKTSIRHLYGLLATLFKKRLWHRCFPVNFPKFLRAGGRMAEISKNSCFSNKNKLSKVWGSENQKSKIKITMNTFFLIIFFEKNDLSTVRVICCDVIWCSILCLSQRSFLQLTGNNVSWENKNKIRTFQGWAPS